MFRRGVWQLWATETFIMMLQCVFSGLKVKDLWFACNNATYLWSRFTRWRTNGRDSFALYMRNHDSWGGIYRRKQTVPVGACSKCWQSACVKLTPISAAHWKKVLLLASSISKSSLADTSFTCGTLCRGCIYTTSSSIHCWKNLRLLS